MSSVGRCYIAAFNVGIDSETYYCISKRDHLRRIVNLPLPRIPHYNIYVQVTYVRFTRLHVSVLYNLEGFVISSRS